MTSNKTSRTDNAHLIALLEKLPEDIRLQLLDVKSPITKETLTEIDKKLPDDREAVLAAIELEHYQKQLDFKLFLWRFALYWATTIISGLLIVAVIYNWQSGELNSLFNKLMDYGNIIFSSTTSPST